MLPIQDWLNNHNLPPSHFAMGGSNLPLQGEALTYALVMYLLHSEQVPDEVITVLAEHTFAKMFTAGEEN